MAQVTVCAQWQQMFEEFEAARDAPHGPLICSLHNAQNLVAYSLQVIKLKPRSGKCSMCR
jgi:hypothetical protein